MALLQVIKGLNPGQQFPLEKPRAVLGRHPECDIVLDVGAISRQHAQILCEGNDFYVEDLKSRNGTFVNGELVQGRRKLAENDRVKICDLLFTFHLGQPSARLIGETVESDDMSSSGGALMVDDAGASNTTIMSTLDVAASRSGVQLAVKPEVKLKALLEIIRTLGPALSLDQVLNKALDSLFRIFLQADRGFVVLREPQRGTLVPMAVKHRRGGQEETIRISRTIVNQVMTTKEAILSADAASDARFDSSQSVADFRIRSMMCAPLVDSGNRALGVIQIDTLDQRSRFQQEDLDVLASVAGVAAIAVENAQLHETALQQQKLESDLELAHKVQQGILPSAPPKVDGYSFFDFYEPASQVGGDYFDYVPLSGNRLAMVLADVSGKGISASLLVAKLSSEARYCLASESDPAEALNRLNASFSRGGWQDRFVTMIAAILDLDRHEVTLANAGHMAPILRRRNRKLEQVGDEVAGLPVGVDADQRYELCRLALEPGDSLTIFTDGISEAFNARKEQYGFDRLHRVLSIDVPSVQALGGRILDDVRQFVGNHPQSDDMCLICFGRT